MPNVMLLGDGAFGECLDYKGRTLMNGICALKKGTQRAPLPFLPYENSDYENSDYGLRVRKRDLTRHESVSAMILDFPAFRTVRNKFPFFTGYLVYNNF